LLVSSHPETQVIGCELRNGKDAVSGSKPVSKSLR
jgi:hypothetical protein